MKKIGVVIFGLALVVGVILSNVFSFGSYSGDLFNFSLHVNGVKGSGRSAVDQRESGDFTDINVGGIFKVEIDARRPQGIEVEADENLLQYIKTDISGHTLNIAADRKLSPTNPITIRVGAADVNSLDVSGAADVSYVNVRTESLSVDSSGASKIRLQGETRSLTVDVSGATKVNADELTSIEATVDASGASRAAVNVRERLIADASGASTVVYTGSPSVEKKTSGASRVSPRE